PPRRTRRAGGPGARDRRRRESPRQRAALAHPDADASRPRYRQSRGEVLMTDCLGDGTYRVGSLLFEDAFTFTVVGWLTNKSGSCHPRLSWGVLTNREGSVPSLDPA